MSRKYLFWLAGGATAVTASLFILAGCGGGGGPISSTTTPPVSNTRLAFQKLLPSGQAKQNSDGTVTLLATYVGSSTCASCHTGHPGSDTTQVDLAAFQLTKHFKDGITCEDCHGPASAHVANPTTDNILTQPNLSNAAVCEQCHGPIASDYANSPHAKIVADPVESASNNCLRCHSAALRTDQIEFAEWQGATRSQVNASILALAPSDLKGYADATQQTASCQTCHNPMATTGQIFVQTVGGALEDAQVYRPSELLDTTDIAPGVGADQYTDVHQVCGTCHNARGGKADDASLSSSSGTSRPSFHHGPQMNMLLGISGCETAPNGTITPPAIRNTTHANMGNILAPSDTDRQCIHCHMPNASHTMTVNLDVSCAPCHTPADAAARLAIQGEIQNDLYILLTQLQAWARTNLGGQDLWDYTAQIPAGETAPSQSLIPIQIKRVRHNYYYVLSDSSFGVHNPVYIRYLMNLASQNMMAAPTKAPLISRAAILAQKPSKQQIMGALSASLARFKAAQRGAN